MLLKRLFCLCLVGALPLSQADAQSPLASVPEDAAVVVRFSSIESLQSVVPELANAIHEDLGEGAERGIQEMFAEMIRYNSLEGVDESNDWFVVIFADGPGRPDAVLMIPATDAAKVLSGVPASGFSRDGYVFVCPTGADAESLLDASEADSVLTQIPDLESFNSAHLAAFVNADYLVATFSNEINRGRQQIEQGLDQLESMPLPNNGVDMKTVVDMYRGMIDWIDDMLADAEALTWALTIADESLVIDKQLTFREGSPSAQELTVGTDDLSAKLSQLPGGMPLYYAASGAGMSELMEMGMNMTLSMVPEGQSAELEEMMGRMQELEFGTMSGCLSMPDGDKPLQAVTAIDIGDVQGYHDFMIEMNEAFGELDLGVLRQTTTVEQAAETYGDRSADIVTVRQEFTGPVAASQQQVNRYMFGDEGMVSRIVYFDDSVLTSMGGGRDLMETAIAASESSEQRVSAWTDGALDNSTLLILFDLPNFARQMLFLVDAATAGQVPIPDQAFEAIEGMSLEESYITASMAADGNSLRGRVTIPASQIKPIVMLFVPVNVAQ